MGEEERRRVGMVGERRGEGECEGQDQEKEAVAPGTKDG